MHVAVESETPQGMENPAGVRRSSSVSGGLNSEPPPLRETLVRLCCETDIPNKSSPDGDADWLIAPAAETRPAGFWRVERADVAPP